MIDQSAFTIRLEEPQDYDSIHRIITEAFTGSTHGYHGEADLVSQLRDQCERSLSLIAMRRETPVGHVLFSAAQISTTDSTTAGYAMAPVSVQPDHQRTGVGTALINAGLVQLKSMQCRFVVVIGNPVYYRRFGFEAAGNFRLGHTFDGIPQKDLMVHWLPSDSAENLSGGPVHYHGEFNAWELFSQAS